MLLYYLKSINNRCNQMFSGKINIFKGHIIMLFILFLLLTIGISTDCWYQDCVVNGKIIEKGERNCYPSYLILKKVFNMYKRPFTVLDIGAAQGFFSFMTAHDYDATCVMVEGDYGYQKNTSKLFELCKKNTDLDKIIFLKKLIDLDFLKNISDCEHFDVTLALNFVHHCGLDWQNTINLLIEMGDNLILENPPCDEVAAPQAENEKHANIDAYMKKIGAIIIGEVERFNPSLSKSKIWWLHKPKNYLKRRHLYWPPPTYISYDNNKRHVVKSSFAKKELIKRLDSREIKSNWINGINLITFLTFNGIYPTRELILHEVTRLKSEQLQDWGLANMVISGQQLHLIDRQDFSYQADYENLAFFIKSNVVLDSEIYWHLNQHQPNIEKILSTKTKLAPMAVFRSKPIIRKFTRQKKKK